MEEQKYRALFAKVARQLSKDEASTLAYIYKVWDIPSKYRSATTIAMYVLQRMEKEGRLIPNASGTAFVQALEDIDRIDLKKHFVAQAKELQQQSEVTQKRNSLKQRKMPLYYKPKRPRKNGREKRITEYYKKYDHQQSTCSEDPLMGT